MKLSPTLFISFILATLASCRTTTGGYFGDRLNDAIDMIPFSVAVGPGFYVGARATAFAGTGLGYAETHRAGWKRREADAKQPQDLKGFKSWHENETGILVLWRRTDDPRTSAGNVGFVVPIHGEENAFKFRPALEVGSALDGEVSLHLGIVGLRLGVSPIQVLDWLVGWTTLDMLNDDLNARFYNTKEKAREPEVPSRKENSEKKGTPKKKEKKA